MSGPDAPGAPVGGAADEFETIARLLRPLTGGAPEALNLADDAAVIPSRPGFDLVVSKDALVCGVHFLPDDPLDLVARKLLRVNLSDLAAKAAEPYGYFLAVAWPENTGWPERERFAAGLAKDQDLFGLRLFGGDTVATPGPLTLSVTIIGWVPQGRMVRRSGAQPGDHLLVSGEIGDGVLGLRAAQGRLAAMSPAEIEALADRYRLPRPRLGLRAALLGHARAAADVSDGLLADAGRVAEASGLGLDLALEQVPLSAAAAAWAELQSDRAAALAALAAGGDDYEIACAVAPEEASAFIESARAVGVPVARVGVFRQGRGVAASFEGRPLAVDRLGYRHGAGDNDR